MEDDRLPKVYASAASTNHNCSIDIGCMSSKRKGTPTKKKVRNVFFLHICCFLLNGLVQL